MHNNFYKLLRFRKKGLIVILLILSVKITTDMITLYLTNSKKSKYVITSIFFNSNYAFK